MATTKSVPSLETMKERQAFITRKTAEFLEKGGKVDAQETVTSHEPPKGAWRGNNNMFT